MARRLLEQPRKQAQAVQRCSRSRVPTTKSELLREPAEPCANWKHELNSKRLYKVEPRLDDNYDSKNSPSARKELRLRGVPTPQKSGWPYHIRDLLAEEG